MQIKDLSVKAERLDTVRGGIGNIDVNIYDATVYAEQNSEIGGGGHSQTSLTKSPVDVFQGITANTKVDFSMPVTETRTRSRSFLADNGANVRFGGRRGW